MNTDIVLTSIPSRMDNHYRPPLSLMYVAGYYQSKGLKVRILDYPITEVRTREFWKNRELLLWDRRKRMLRDIEILQPKMVGLSCYSPEFEEVIGLVKDIKARFPCKVIVGGIHPTLFSDEFKDKGVDFCYQGRLDNGLPAYSLVDMEHYTTPNPYAIRGVYLSCAYVLASFGCPGRCTFCVAPKMRSYFGIATFKTPTVLWEEIVGLRNDYGIDAFYLIDDLYTMDKKKTMEFCQLIKHEGLFWGCSSKVTTLNEEVISTMAKAGCIQIDLGIERGSDEALKKVQKDITIKQVKDVCAICKRHKVRVFANFLVGLPEETPKDREEIECLVKDIRPDILSINKFTPYQGTQIFEEGFQESKNRDLDRWISYMMKKYNSVWTGIRFHLSLRYLRLVWKSQRRKDYLWQIPRLIKEMVNQKWAS